MNIIVCMKQVPDTTEVKFDPVTGALNRVGIPTIINPDDLAGLEVALRLKEQENAKVTVITMGPSQSIQLLRESLAMGADEGILISDRAFGGSDSLATSNIIASALKRLPYDLIITGRQAIDGDTAQVGPQIAEFLNIRSAIYVDKIELVDQAVIVKRTFENSYQTLKVCFPCLVTVIQEITEPRLMNAVNIFQTDESAQIKIWTKDDFELIEDLHGLKKSPTKVKKTYTKQRKKSGEVFHGNKTDSAAAIIKKLKEHIII